MNVYVVTGYDNPDRSTDWDIFGIYTTRKKAEELLIALANASILELKRLNRFDEYCVNCYYNERTKELMSIYNYSDEFFFTIIKRELIGE